MLMNMKEAIRQALDLALSSNDDVLIFGEDVGGAGGVFRVTEGLQHKYGEERVFDTPLAESAICGLAVGLGTQGFRPVVEIQFIGFIYEAMDQIFVQAARMRYRSGGRYHAPITYRIPFGGGVKGAEMHNDSLEGLMIQSPGIKVVVPSNPYDAKGLLLSAIRDQDPVIFLEHLKLYHLYREEVPEEDYMIPIGKAKCVKEGQHLTLITYGAMVQSSIKAAEAVEQKHGITVEIIDLRTLVPLDIDTIVQSIAKTNRAVVVQEAQRTSGAAAEIIAQINERAILHLEAPVKRVAPPDTVYPFAQIEDQWLPSVERIEAGIEQVLEF
ncbi:alpha-ketoacid dehydrogenase subunit beta [Paenibacillus xylaniclasticus]|uniref:alpha-ketoacid dehydrogenase subunit beta n=1 Tax=Paenibacillus xylaniclasticus TaxID=588083 RepID=UPI000FDB6BA3|nr:MULTISPECIES: alpha-ketoacid dehydrogenase subunit beta [Paenibacillus]GFN33002.1 pyruvate dehydrogenase E1 component subunit beta [Paenibacillus curdlanolyticus]